MLYWSVQFGYGPVPTVPTNEPSCAWSTGKIASDWPGTPGLTRVTVAPVVIAMPNSARDPVASLGSIPDAEYSRWDGCRPPDACTGSDLFEWLSGSAFQVSTVPWSALVIMLTHKPSTSPQGPEVV